MKQYKDKYLQDHLELIDFDLEKETIIEKGYKFFTAKKGWVKLTIGGLAIALLVAILSTPDEALIEAIKTAYIAFAVIVCLLDFIFFILYKNKHGFTKQ